MRHTAPKLDTPILVAGSVPAQKKAEMLGIRHYLTPRRHNHILFVPTVTAGIKMARKPSGESLGGGNLIVLPVFELKSDRTELIN
jgi:hypothetical protein